jgi:hypothetical protein
MWMVSGHGEWSWSVVMGGEWEVRDGMGWWKGERQ